MKKGFTLIELLAVIVILAIIALIATPIILGIIADARNEAKIRSAELYLTALEQAIMRKKMSDTTFNPSSCDINGQIVTCGGETLNVDVDGEKPTSGTITINNGQTEEVKLSYTDLEFETDANNNLVSYERAYEIGEEVTFIPGTRAIAWNVIAETKDTVTLMMSDILGEKTTWYWIGSNVNGPSAALVYLNELTKDWDNVDSIQSYEYINNLNGENEGKGYQKLEIVNGVITITTLDAEEKTPYEIQSEEYPNTGVEDPDIPTLYEESPAKARLITKEEVEALLEKNIDHEFINNFNAAPADYDIDGYWTLTGVEDSSNWSAYSVRWRGEFYDEDVESYFDTGMRPVITIPKTKLQ